MSAPRDEAARRVAERQAIVAQQLELLPFSSRCRQCGHEHQASYPGWVSFRRVIQDAENAHAAAHPECPAAGDHHQFIRCIVPSY